MAFEAGMGFIDGFGTIMYKYSIIIKICLLEIGATPRPAMKRHVSVLRRHESRYQGSTGIYTERGERRRMVRPHARGTTMRTITRRVESRRGTWGNSVRVTIKDPHLLQQQICSNCVRHRRYSPCHKSLQYNTPLQHNIRFRVYLRLWMAR
jgi:hypothetical protein